MCTSVANVVKRYTLSLAPDYVSDWGFWEACRELLQNAIDQRTLDPLSSVVLDYDVEAEELRIGSTRGSLSPGTLLLGVSGKREDKNLIGAFGEGYKLALLVLTRSSYDVHILNGSRKWQPRFVESEDYGTQVMIIDETLIDDPDEGVVFVIRDVSEKAFGRITERYLPDQDSNVILTEEYLRGRVFVNGLFVCEIDELRYGYNFHPSRLRLGRDRMMVATYEAAWATSRLWESHTDAPELYENLKAGILDVMYVNSVPAKTGNAIVDRFLAENPGAMPVSSDAEAKRFAGGLLSFVPVPLRNMLRKLHEFSFGREGCPSERLERFEAMFGHGFDKEAKREFQSILEESKNWTGPISCSNSAELKEVTKMEWVAI